MRRSLSLALLAATALTAFSSLAHADFNALLPRIPTDANTVVAIDSTTVLDSPLAKSEGWGTKGGDAPLFLPRHSSKIIIASDLNLATMDPNWTVGLVETSKEVSLSAIQLSESGLKDTLATIPAIWSARKAYFLAIDKNTLGIVSPDDRQFATKFATQQLSPKTTVITPYLSKAVGEVKGKTDIVIALDLSDAIGLNKVRRGLMTNLSRATILQDASIDGVAKLLTSAKGITLKIDVDKDISTTLSVDFGSDPSVLKDVSLPLLQDILSANGLGLKEVETWTSAVSGNSIVFSGKLTVPSFRLVMGLFEPHTPNETAASEADPASAGGTPAPADNSQATVIAASQKYYKQMSSMLDSFSQPSSAGDGAAWLRRSAQRIDRMSLVNVDPELANWGAQVSAVLLDCASQLATGQTQITSTAAGAAAANPVQANNSGYYYTNDNGDVVTDTDSQIKADYKKQTAAKIQASQAERARVVAPVNARLADVLASKSKIRLAMVEKYKVNF